MKPKVRLLHTSDLHIGAGSPSPVEGKHLNPCLCSLKAVINASRSERVDALLIAGDLFDHSRLDVHVVSCVKRLLTELNVPCVILPGNHDRLGKDSIYSHPEWLTFASGVTVLREESGETIALLSGSLELWGRAIVSHSPRFRPLQAAPEWRANVWRIALAHGHYVSEGNAGNFGWSSPITTAEISATRADYVALGHWHRTEQVNGDGIEAWYSGSPTSGIGDGNALIVMLSESSGTVVSRIALRVPTVGCVDDE